MSDQAVSPAVMSRRGMVMASAFAWAFTVVHLVISMVVLGHSYPLSVYPALVAFVTTWRVAREKRPPVRAIALFCAGWTGFTAILAVITSGASGLPGVEPSLLLEPLWLVPVVVLVLGLAKIVQSPSFHWVVLVACGGCMLVLAAVTAIPGNPVVVYFSAPPGGAHDLLDTVVPAGLMVDVVLFMHVIAIWVPVGSVSVFAGLAITVLRIDIKGGTFVALALAIVVSIYAVGLPVVWLLLAPGRGEPLTSQA